MILPVSLSLLLGSLLVNAMPARRQDLAQVITSCTVPKTAALTFDDGPSAFTTLVGNTLTTAGVKGTFFFNGNNYGCIYTAENMQHVKNVYGQGHQVASHTWAHLDLTTLTSDQISSEMGKTEEAIQRITGATPAFTRPPYGNSSTLVQQVAAAHGQKLVLWDFDSGDSQGMTAEQSAAAYTALVGQAPPSILALNHDVYETTAKQLLPAAIAALKAGGYNLVTVAECLGLQPYSTVGTAQTGTWSCT